ncbi:MAG: ubiquitin-conjugating enzyme E2 [Amphiamblys sp. WSBS2006]|nr:MAG: ubiquitin-conjugating enzyme E2 [Amphiamblys sp. WSBS2006]
MSGQRRQQQPAVRRLMREYTEFSKQSPEGFVAAPVGDNIMLWEAYVQGPSETVYEGGLFRAELRFPGDYPLSPPTMYFKSEIFHPNIYESGEVCISILHQPGEDPNMYEDSSERWTPVQSVEKILLSVISMLSEPNPESGANIEACKCWRTNKEEYRKIVRKNIEKSVAEYFSADEKTTAHEHAAGMAEECAKAVFR